MTDYGALLRDHVTLRCRSIDRIFLQAYVPRLQAGGTYARFFAGSGDIRFLHQPPLAKLAKAMSRPCTVLPKPIISRWFISKRQRRKKTPRGRISTPRRGKERTASCSSGWHKRRRRV